MKCTMYSNLDQFRSITPRLFHSEEMEVAEMAADLPGTTCSVTAEVGLLRQITLPL